ncbi:MAG: NAD(P)-dependent oxidoreductase [Pseudomonadota bacterium]
MKPLLILDNHFRKRDELFSEASFTALNALCDVRGGENAPMPRHLIEELLPDAMFYVASHPSLSRAEIASAPNLKATIEVSGAFRDGLDYDACFNRGIEVLSCSPGFRNAVAEMALAMTLAGGRSLIAEHEAFRNGTERWLDDREDTDATLYGQTVGFIGYGEIARETHRLMKPFGTRIMAYDPHLKSGPHDVELTDLTTLARTCRTIIVAAVPTETSRELVNAAMIAEMQLGALVVVISRAWCVDFPALVSAAEAGRIRVATDVFPDEPLAEDHAVRRSQNVILSPHRAAAVPGGRRLIGDMILHDVGAMLNGKPERQLKRAEPDAVAALVAAQSEMSAMPNT